MQFIFAPAALFVFDHHVIKGPAPGQRTIGWLQRQTEILRQIQSIEPRRLLIVGPDLGIGDHDLRIDLGPVGGKPVAAYRNVCNTSEIIDLLEPPWREIGRDLGLTADELEAIGGPAAEIKRPPASKMKNVVAGNVAEMRDHAEKMLNKWIESNGDDATTDELIAALKKRKLNDTAGTLLASS